MAEVTVASPIGIRGHLVDQATGAHHVIGDAVGRPIFFAGTK